LNREGRKREKGGGRREEGRGGILQKPLILYY